MSGPKFPSEVPAGTVYTVEGSEEFGRIPVRTELTVLPADDPAGPTLGWIIKEYNGGEVFLLDAQDQPIEEPLTRREDLKEGMRIYAPTLVGGRIATVRLEEDGDLCWESAGLIGDLNFSGDDRKCWITTLAINKKLLR